jgi:FixJ family two-component response regulator
MPKMSGPELLDSLSKSHPKMKVIFMTGYAGDYFVRRQLPSGYESVLSKPFSSQELLTLISRTLAVSRPRH